MATAEVASRPQQDRPRRKPFTQWVKNLTNLKHKEKESGGKKSQKKGGQANGGTLKNNPYPKSGNHLQERRSLGSSADGNLSFAQDRSGSYGSLPTSTVQDRDGPSHGNRSGAPTLATKAETVHSDAGYSKAATTTTRGGALSSIDGAGADSTFSSPTQSQHSLTTTLTTIQSTGAGNTLQSASAHPHSNQHGLLNSPGNVMFSHQYPVSPAPGTPGDRISAIPRHVADSMPNTYNSATANNLLTDNASILTLASSSKRRRRSMDTDASVRALAPSSVWGGSRESLPLSVLSSNVEASSSTPGGYISQSRPSIGGLASAERASVYSSQGAGLASERNSLISHRAPTKDIADAKSMRSITLNDKADSRSLGGDVGSLRGYEGSMRSGKVDHSRNDSIPGSIGSPLVSPRPGQGIGGLSRRSSDWADVDADPAEDDEDESKSRHIEEEEEDEAKAGLEERERASKEEQRPVVDGP